MHMHITKSRQKPVPVVWSEPGPVSTEDVDPF